MSAAEALDRNCAFWELDITFKTIGHKVKVISAAINEVVVEA